MKPFLKWAGGKMRLVTRLQALLPPAARLVEPFVGSGAIFLNTNYSRYYLNDLNNDLITLFAVLRSEREELIEQCRAYFTPETNREDVYYALRNRFNSSADRVDKSALFVYLNKHGFNGLCRYNNQGQFNVPFGRHVRPYFPEQEMRAFSERAALAEFANHDFRDVFAVAGREDVIYCDPPYIPLSATANFTSYGPVAFGLDEQKALAELAFAASRRGITVVISNHNVTFTREIYRCADRLDYFDVQRHISCDGANRAKAAELIAIYEGRA